jgi:hypothetical protein
MTKNQFGVDPILWTIVKTTKAGALGQSLRKLHVGEVMPGRQRQGPKQRQGRPSGFALCGRTDPSQMPVDPGCGCL